MSPAATLQNPERAWFAAATPRLFTRADVERRVGPTREPIELLSGGLANLNVRLGRDRVLRIHRNPAALALETTLLRHPWRSFRTPAVLAAGPDFLLLEHLELRPLPATAGAAVGRALAEIHARTYPSSGDLAADLTLAAPSPFAGFAARGYGHANLADALPHLDPALAARIAAFLDTDEYAARDALDAPVLCHCDFKLSNLHLTPDDELVVLDWEFAWSGPRLLDIGQLLRWRPPPPFVEPFADAYRAGGGVLIEGWRRIAEAIDLGSLLSVYARNPAARTTPDIERRLAEITARASPPSA